VFGLVGGAWLSGRMAERRSARFTVNLGYAAMLLACALHIVFALVFPAPKLPWSMLPLTLEGIGVQLAFPTLTLLLLDRFSSQRGGISSVQAFASLLLCSAVAGVISPILSGSMLRLALGASALSAIGMLSWWWYGSVGEPVATLPRAVADASVTLQAEIAEPL